MEFQKKHRPNRYRPQDELRTLIRQARQVADGLDRDAFNRRPEPDRWSVGECIEHLNASARLYLPALTEAIADARQRGLIGTRRSGRTLLGRLVVWSMEPPPKRLTIRTTWPELEPARDLAPADTLEQFELLHEELIIRMNEATDLDLKKVKMRSVLDRRLKLSLGDWFAFLPAHARRHLWQAARTRQRIEA